MHHSLLGVWLVIADAIFFVVYNYCYDLRGSCSWESMKSPFDDEKFIYRRNFAIKQAPSAEAIYN